jgi:hypothetical protein
VRYLIGILVVAAIVAAALPIDDRRNAPAESRRAAPAPTPESTPQPRQPRDVARSRCPEGVPGCRAVRGTVLYVERVDPDGDGDLHVVLSGGGITLPGLTAVDVRPGLRPGRDPREGDGVAAAGPVQRGSYGQSQIHALAFRVRRR